MGTFHNGYENISVKLIDFTGDELAKKVVAFNNLAEFLVNGLRISLGLAAAARGHHDKHQTTTDKRQAGLKMENGELRISCSFHCLLFIIIIM